MPDELITTKVEGSGIVATEEVKLDPSHVDEFPQLTPEVQAEVDRLAKVKAQQLKRDEFDDQTKKAEEKALYWRKEKAREREEFFKGKGRVEPPEPSQPSTPKPPEKPKRDDFDDYDSFVEALADWKADTKIAKWREEETQRTGQVEHQNKMSSFREKLITDGYTKYPDFEDVVFDATVPITPKMVEILAETEHPEDTLYYLGKNRLEAIKIARMTPFAAHKEILRIEADLMKTANNPPQKKVPGAPPPIKTVGSSDIVTKDVSKMTQKEYEAWAKERGMPQY